MQLRILFGILSMLFLSVKSEAINCTYCGPKSYGSKIECDDPEVIKCSPTATACSITFGTDQNADHWVDKNCEEASHHNESVCADATMSMKNGAKFAARKCSCLDNDCNHVTFEELERQIHPERYTTTKAPDAHGSSDSQAGCASKLMCSIIIVWFMSIMVQKLLF